mmetsp:Transcript_34755/g.83984  ORF Transcript_34755/g.83984 Transcript_34755/m.83984 type:complete len:217 (-) Transcript_34755:1351-2001(-)
MKLSSSCAILACLAGSGHAFSLQSQHRATTTATQLDAATPTRTPTTDRRGMLVDVFTAATTVTAASFVALPVPPAFAAEYVPQFKDMKQIYVLGQGLDRLIAKLKDPDQIETVREGVKTFNRDPNFYSGYAKNFIMKTVKKGSDSDPRVGYIKQASTLISSLESVLGGGDALMNEKTTTDEAIKRIEKAQALVVKFLDESGVTDEEVTSFIASHKK